MDKDMRTGMEKQFELSSLHKHKRPTKIKLNKMAVQKYGDQALVWYNRADGWWLESPTDEIFLGCDIFGAYHTLAELTHQDHR